MTPYRLISLLLLLSVWATPAFARKAEPIRVPLYNNFGKHHLPGTGHLVHMPAHTYIRLGMYKEAEEA